MLLKMEVVIASKVSWGKHGIKRDRVNPITQIYEQVGQGKILDHFRLFKSQLFGILTLPERKQKKNQVYNPTRSEMTAIQRCQIWGIFLAMLPYI